jgi:hypothetical protein
VCGTEWREFTRQKTIPAITTNNKPIEPKIRGFKRINGS